MYKILITLFVSLLFTASTYAQTGSVKGVISDSTNAESLIGAVVSLVGNSSIGGVTDIDGSFTIDQVPEGKHTFKVAYLGYKERIVENVVVKAGQTTDLGAFVMASEEEALVVTVTGTRVTNSEEAVVAEVKESKQVVSAISAEQISKSQDRDAAQVMQRVPGVTLIQNRFVMVRGLNQRYNSVLLNGIVAPSSESDSRAFSFDLIPSALLDRLLVYKSGSADMPGDFAGSVIKVYTRNTTSDNETLVSVTGGYRVGTTFGQMESQRRFAGDGFGFGTGKRDYPSGFPNRVPDVESISSQSKAEQATKSFDNDWAMHKFMVMPDLRISILDSKKFKIGSVKVNTINSVGYTNTWQTQYQDRNFYWNYNTTDYKSENRWYNRDTVYSNDVRVSALSNWAFIINSNHKIEFRNLYSKLSTIEDTKRTGYNNEQQKEYTFTSLRYQSNDILTSQLQGTHNFHKEKGKLTWVGGYSDIRKREPNWRRYGYQKNMNTDDPFLLIVNTGASATSNARFSTDMKENGFTGGVDLNHGLNKTIDSSKFVVKTGVFTDIKSRTYAARWMSYSKATDQSNISTLDQPIENILIDQNFGYPGGLILKEGTRPQDAYTASSNLLAGYVGFSSKILRNINLSAGVRLESFNQKVNSKLDGGSVKIDTTYTSILPSANLSYNFTEKVLVRGAYFRSLNRPEFRELAPFPFYDFSVQADRVGNPNLKVADINNYEVRAEWYPGEGEMISFGVFYKDFKNPIETYLIPASSNFLFTPGNAKGAQVYGLELEVRKSLKGITSSALIDRLSVLFNGSLIKSQIVLADDAPGNLDRNRPMQGQAPWIVNTGLYYFDDNRGVNVTLLYNVFGPRLYTVGDFQNPSWYEMPRHMLDLTVSKDISKKTSLKIGISDLLNSKIRIKEDANFDEKLNTKDVDKDIMNTNTGQYFMIGLNVKL